MGKLTNSMAMFNSYVKLPEGTLHGVPLHYITFKNYIYIGYICTASIWYIHMVVDLNSFICRRPFFANKKSVRESFATLRVSFAELLLSIFLLLRRAQTACERQLCEWSGRQPAKIQGHVGIPPGNNKLCFQVPLTLQRCWVGCGTFAKNPMQINQEIHNLNCAWGFAAPLDCK